MLASASTARAALLRAAGIEFAIEPAAIDEAPMKRETRAAGESATACASFLAIEKARAMSRRHPDALVIGADQILALGTEWFDKPRELGEAREQLLEIARRHAHAGDRGLRGRRRGRRYGRRPACRN